MITAAKSAGEALESGCDFVMLGRGGVLVPDFPRRLLADPAFEAPSLPVSPQLIEAMGWGPAFLDYVASWPGFLTRPDQE